MHILPILLVLMGAGVATSDLADSAAFVSAVQSITAVQVKRHVDVLADDSFEGRAAGSRGGQAAGNYILDLLKKYEIPPGGPNGSYVQMFHGGSRNILARIEGAELPNEYIVVGAHFDHVGYGNRNNSFGPFGYVHNGADDNASGTAALLEIVEAFSMLDVQPKRSILFVFWDGEEQGLLGSKYWLSNSTIPLSQVKAYINLDMVGRLRNDRVEVYGTRTSPGLREWVSEANSESALKLDFRWEMKPNSDHYPFFEKGIPSLMFHTGLHDEYHRPQDDAHLINNQGIERVSQLAIRFIWKLANQSSIAGFRSKSRSETEGQRSLYESGQVASRSRLGIRWNPDNNAEDRLVISGITPESSADDAGLQVGDRILKFAGAEYTSTESFLAQVQAAPKDVLVHVERDQEDGPLPIEITLSLDPAPIGIAWDSNDAEPNVVLLRTVTRGSIAWLAGLRPGDRIVRINGKRFHSNTEFKDLVTQFGEPIRVERERDGQLTEVQLPVEFIRTVVAESP